MAGTRFASGKLKVGYFTQYQVEELDGDATPVLMMGRAMKGSSPSAVRAQLGRFGFTGPTAEQRIGTMSGGEKARLALALVTRDAPHLIVLDEPTNHLDIDMREALAEALSDFDGAIVLVSHDRHLIGLVSETFWRVADGRVDPFNGDLDEYAIWLKARGNKADQAASKVRSEAKAEAVKPQVSPKSAGELGKLQKQVEKLESRMVELDSQLAHIQEEMARPELYQSDGGAVLLQLGQQQQKLESERAEAEARWLEAYGALENG